MQVKKKMNPVVFWVLSLTWALPMTLVGALIFLALLCAGRKPKRFHYLFYIEIGESWGGFNVGPFFIVSKDPGLHIKQHESGHAIQNITYGPLTPFIVSIPSMCRYWYREFLVKTGRKKYNELPPYDSAWFEGEATRLGEQNFS